MRIAIVINTSWNIYNFRQGLVKKLLQEGHQVIAIAPEDEFSKHLIEWGCEFLPLKMQNKGTNPISDFLLFFRFCKLYKQSKAEVFLQYTIKPNIYGTLAAKWLNKKSLCNVSGLGTVFLNPEKLSSKIAFLLYKFAFKFPKKVFFQNSDDKTLFLDRKLVKSTICDVLPGSGVDLNKFKPLEKSIESEIFVFLMISRLLVDKGVREYAEAAKILKSKGLNAKFQILGKFDESRGSVAKTELEDWIKNNYIEFLGETNDVRSYIQNCDCVVLPSYREGTPKTLLEAMAMQKPLVATDVPGCKETVVNEKNGYLCQVKSSLDLANKMQTVFECEKTALKQMGIESRKIAEEKFDENIIINKYIALINESD